MPEGDIKPYYIFGISVLLLLLSTDGNWTKVIPYSHHVLFKPSE